LKLRVGDLFNLDPHPPLRGSWVIEEYRFDEIRYVKKMTPGEARVALRFRILDDLEDHEYEGPDKECLDEEAVFNLSLSDAEPSVG
jgi:hypothetical protein